jgi:hypothetical protein
MHENGSLGLSGDFLIAPNGRVVASKYGDHAYDQWTVDEVLELAKAGGAGDGAATNSAAPQRAGLALAHQTPGLPPHGGSG